MAVVALVDLLAGPQAGYLPLLTLGPAFASLSCGTRRTALVGLLALTLCVSLGFYDQVLGRRQHTLMIAAIVGVTAASVLASSIRHERERVLADVRSVAEVAQQVLLRPVPRRIGPIHVAVSYTSAAAEARIGGDLYEAVSVPGGVRVIIGDVQGKGLDAVETAAAVLGAFREAAHDEPDLGGVVARLDATLARRLSGEKFVTAVLAEFGTGDTVSLLNCGHPSPLVLGVDSECFLAEPDDVAPPLGLADLVTSRPRPYAVKFALGDRMLFYTDGIIEARDQAGRFYPLIDRVGVLGSADPQEALDRLRADVLAHVGGPLTDDAAMLLVGRRAEA
jgi:serine phosphatase RsbU (regulator of sigma subunit)